MSNTVTAKKPKDEFDAEPPMTRKDDDVPEINEELQGKDAPKTTQPVASKPPTPFDALTEFLGQHSITDDAELAVFRQLRVLSLNDLLAVLPDEQELKALSDALVASGARFAVRKLQGITIEAVRNEIYFLKNPGSKDTSTPLLDFLAVQNVLSDPNDRDVLLCIFLENNTPSLAALHKLKAGGHRQLSTLTGAITKWKAAAGAAFRRITPARAPPWVAIGIVDGGPNGNCAVFGNCGALDLHHDAGFSQRRSGAIQLGSEVNLFGERTAIGRSSADKYHKR
jgi:hypothetical protein